MLQDDTPAEPTGTVTEDRLRLIFTCCHPALAPENRIALTLRLLGGLTVAEIAHAFLVPETTMAQRITRAEAKRGSPTACPWSTTSRIGWRGSSPFST
jgi:RNA polymerase sigma-70 factor (ECF subfamily)